MRSLTIINQTQSSLSAEFLKNIAGRALKFLNISNYEISLVLLTQVKIKKINFRYRRRNESTDVLSFAYLHSRTDIEGEIFICPSVIRRHAEKYALTYDAELVKVVVHSILHLLGYTHDKQKDYIKMEKKSAQILRLINVE